MSSLAYNCLLLSRGTVTFSPSLLRYDRLLCCQMSGQKYQHFDNDDLLAVSSDGAAVRYGTSVDDSGVGGGLDEGQQASPHVSISATSSHRRLAVDILNIPLQTVISLYLFWSSFFRCGLLSWFLRFLLRPR